MNDDTTADDYPEVLADMRQHTERVLGEAGVAAEQARAAAHQVAEFMRGHWGGQLVYIAKGRSFETRKRWQEIWDAFDGRNHAELARRFDLGLAQIYKVIEIMRQVTLRRNQRDMFAEGDAP